MVLCPMKNANSPMTHFAAALLGAAMATTLLTNEPLGLSLTPRMETLTLTSRVDRDTHTRGERGERERLRALAISATYGYASEALLPACSRRIGPTLNETLRACDRVLRWRACEHLCEAFLMSIFVTVLTIQ